MDGALPILTIEVWASSILLRTKIESLLGKKQSDFKIEYLLETNNFDLEQENKKITRIN
jgi:hypothetical protein